jgi:hypothetical protein
MFAFDISDHQPARIEETTTVGVRTVRAQRMDDWLTVALEDSFPCSDPISSMRVD